MTESAAKKLALNQVTKPYVALFAQMWGIRNLFKFGWEMDNWILRTCEDLDAQTANNVIVLTFKRGSERLRFMVELTDPMPKMSTWPASVIYRVDE